MWERLIGGPPRFEKSTKEKSAPPPPVPPENERKVVRRIEQRVRRGPSARDARGGYIYVYRMARETGRNFWKVGMTEQRVDARMAQWASTHKDRVLCVDRYYLEHNHALAERLCHLYLNYCRVNRYPFVERENGRDVTRFYSTWYRNGEPVEKEDAFLKERPVARNKHTEWFLCDKKALDRVLTSVIAYCRERKPPEEAPTAEK